METELSKCANNAPLDLETSCPKLKLATHIIW